MKLMKNIRYLIYLTVAIGFSTVSAGSYDAFFAAVESDDASTIRSLAERGFDLNSRDPNGQTALYLALRGNSFSVASALLAMPAFDVNTLNQAGESALMMAAMRGLDGWSRRLIEHGAQVNKSGWSPLHYAATGPDPNIVKLLLDHGAAIDAESPNRTTPLMMAAQYGNEASVDVLLARGANLKLKNDQGLDVVDFARLARRDALVTKLERLAR